jgi:hypothetical protein
MSSEESGMELSGSTQFSESPEISLGPEEPIEQGDDGLEEDLARMDEEAGRPDEETGVHDEEVGTSDQGAGINLAGVNLAAYTRGAWKGSSVTKA